MVIGNIGHTPKCVCHACLIQKQQPKIAGCWFKCRDENGDLHLMVLNAVEFDGGEWMVEQRVDGILRDRSEMVTLSVWNSEYWKWRTYHNNQGIANPESYYEDNIEEHRETIEFYVPHTSCNVFPYMK
jgi:hypothetical protein